MGIHGSQRSNRPGRRTKAARGESGRPARSAAPESPADSVISRLSAYAGYVGAVVLIYQSINGFSDRPVFGFTWSPALLGVVLAIATALFRDELNIRSRLKVFDLETASRPVVSLAWGILAVVAIAAIMLLPRF